MARLLPLLLILGHCLSCTPVEKTSPAKPSSRPNILFIMGDDHTTQAISAYGGILAPYAQTRHIDQLAAEGLRFDRAFCTNSICSPSRATLLTGKYGHENGVRILGQRFDSTQTTSATLLQEAGYQTAVFGKWHLKSQPAGFDDYKVLQVQGRYQDPQFVEKGVDTLVTHPGWSTDVIADMTIDHLQNLDGSVPFFVMCHFKATHDPWASRPPYDTLFQDIDLPEPTNLYDEYGQRSQAALNTTLKLELINQGTYPHDCLPDADWLQQRGHIYQQYIKDFLRCGRVLDENVGRILRTLDDLGLKDNTIVIYTADQGHFLGEHGFFSKRFIYEEAMRIPLIIRYPGLITPGATDNNLVENTDLAPTIVDLAGVAVPEDMQGRPLRPLFSGSVPTDWRTGIYYHYWQHLLHRNVAAHYGLRTKDYKLIFYYGLPLGLTNFPSTPPEWELFDLRKDPQEMQNVYDDPGYQETIRNLKAQLQEKKKELEDLDSAYPDLAKISPWPEKPSSQ